MSEFKQISPEQITRSPFTLIGKDWALLTGGTPEKCNPMTVSWGGVGILWNKPVATVYVRPQRYTLGLLNENEQFTLCFFAEGTHRSTLAYCGKAVSYTHLDVYKRQSQARCSSASACERPQI